MGTLSLRQVPARRGSRWVADSLRLFGRRPLGFVSMFGAFLLVSLLLGLVPLVGVLLQMSTLPLLTLGFMIAGQSASLGGPVQPTQFVQPLRGDARIRRDLVRLCLLYGVSAMAVLALAVAIGGPAWDRLQEVMAKGPATPADVEAALAEGGLGTAALSAVVLGSLLSVPFWHAPALVFWGGQGVAQALFSSTLAVWRARGAFLAYGVAWLGVWLTFVVSLALLTALLDGSRLMGFLAVPVGVVFTAWFYLSVLFSFNDSFGLSVGPETIDIGGDGLPPAT